MMSSNGEAGRNLVQPTDHSATVRSIRALTGRLRSRRILGLVVSILLAAIPALIRSNFWIRVFVQAIFGVMMALGLDIMVGLTGMFNLGYIAITGVGAYLYALLASPHFNIHLPFLVLFPLAGVAGMLVGSLIALPAVRLRGDYYALLTLAFGETIRLLINNLDFLTNGPKGITNIDHPRILSFTLRTPQDYYFLVLILCMVELLLIKRLYESRIGWAWRAIREDEAAARAMGLNTAKLKLLACALGSVPAGLVGVLFAALQTFVDPVSFTVTESIGILSAVVVGGAGNIPGVVTGALLLNILPEPLRKYTQTYRMLIYGGLLVLFTLLRPQGILPAQYSYQKASREQHHTPK